MKKHATKEVKRHYKRVIDFGCCISRNPLCIVHHCHGGSMVQAWGNKSQSQRGISDFLVIPLHPHYHTGQEGIHTLGIDLWETMYGPQTELLEWVNNLLDYDIYELARKGKNGFNTD